MTLTASELLEAGRPILDAVLCPHGFAYVGGATGTGSGGPFAAAEYRRQDRRLMFSCRWALGLVEYRLGEEGLAHEDYMRVAMPSGAQAQYPGFGEDAVDAFRHLASDLERFGRDFLVGSDDEFRRWIRAHRDHPRPSGFAALDPRPADGRAGT